MEETSTRETAVRFLFPANNQHWCLFPVVLSQTTMFEPKPGSFPKPNQTLTIVLSHNKTDFFLSFFNQQFVTVYHPAGRVVPSENPSTVYVFLQAITNHIFSGSMWGICSFRPNEALLNCTESSEQ